jgi:hypothetical protein
MRIPSQPPFSRERDEVEQMLDSGLTFAQVEDAIECCSASDEEKSALWLVAWSSPNVGPATGDHAF